MSLCVAVVPERGRPVRHALPFAECIGKELFSQVVEVVFLISRGENAIGAS